MYRWRSLPANGTKPIPFSYDRLPKLRASYSIIIKLLYYFYFLNSLLKNIEWNCFVYQSVQQTNIEIHYKIQMCSSTQKNTSSTEREVPAPRVNIFLGWICRCGLLPTPHLIKEVPNEGGGDRWQESQFGVRRIQAAAFYSASWKQQRILFSRYYLFIYFQ